MVAEMESSVAEGEVSGDDKKEIDTKKCQKLILVHRGELRLLLSGMGALGTKATDIDRETTEKMVGIYRRKIAKLKKELEDSNQEISKENQEYDEPTEGEFGNQRKDDQGRPEFVD